MNINEFRKQHPLPKTPRPPAPVKIPPSTIDPNEFKVNVSTPKPVVNRDPNELDRYLSRAFSKIKREWLRLKEASNLRSQGAGVVEVTVKFEIGSGGEVRAPRLARASSYPELNHLVLQALRGIGNVGRPPFPISDSLTMTFLLN
ncbi:MAG: TonB C-terminal domain-containing protein [Opitutales bacterium]